MIPNAPDPAIFHPPASREPPDGTAGPRRRHELVGQSAQGRRRARVRSASIGRPGAVRADLRRPHRRSASTGLAPRAPLPSERARRAPSRPGRATSPRASTTRARTRCSRRSRAACRPLYRRSGGHPELVGDAGVGFDGPEERAAALDRLVARARAASGRDRGAVPLADVADRYLEVLRRMTARGRAAARRRARVRASRSRADRDAGPTRVAALRPRRRPRLVARRRRGTTSRRSPARRATRLGPPAWARVDARARPCS